MGAANGALIFRLQKIATKSYSKNGYISLGKQEPQQEDIKDERETMLKAVEAIVEPNGTIRTLEPLRVDVATRAIVTILAPVTIKEGKDLEEKKDLADEKGNGMRLLALLQSPRFANRPNSDPLEVAQRIENLRKDWD